VAETWHHGLIATWWDEFNQGGPEVQFFRRYVEAGQPALDLGCGTGRLLLPYLRAGLDVDGVDASADMLDRCRLRARREGISEPNLYVQALWELDVPRSYRTIYACGVFGIGGDRNDDLEGLRRAHASLEPGGVLVMDNEVPTGKHPPTEWRAVERGDRRRAADGSELALRARTVEVGDDGHVVYEMRAWRWVDDELVDEERHALRLTEYTTDEVKAALHEAGFWDVELRGGYEERPPAPDDAFVVFVARRN
jgi:SAM-dependent methyltransferase